MRQCGDVTPFHSSLGVRSVSAVYTVLLLILIAVSTSVLVHLRGISRHLAARSAATTDTPVDEAAIRRAVTEALAADREREITEARAFWAEQEARAAEDAPLFDNPLGASGTA